MLFEFAIIFAIVLFLRMLLSKFGIPSLASNVLCGILIKIVVETLFKGSNISSSLSEVASIGIILLMFVLGVEFPFSKVMSIKPKIVVIAVFQVVLTSVILSLFFLAFQIQFQTALLFGILFSFSSTVVVSKLLVDRGEVHSREGEISLSILILQDLMIIPVSILLPIVLDKNSVNLLTIVNLLLILIKSTAIFALILALVVKIIPFVLKRISGLYNRDLLLLFVIVLSLFMSSISEKLGFSLAIGAFLSGMIVASTKEKYEIFSEVRPLRDIFSICFFLFLGFSLDLNYLGANIFRIVFFTLAIISLKALIIYGIFVRSNVHKKTAFKIAVNLSQISEFAFILSLYYLKNSWLFEDDQKMIVIVTLLSIIISPFLFNSEKRILKRFSRFFHQKDDRMFLSESNHDLHSHVVICGFGRIGKRIVDNLFSEGIPFIIIDNDKEEVESLQSKGFNAVYGDATDLEILDFARVKNAKIVVIALPDRFSQEIIISHTLRLNRGIIIYARAHETRDKQYLYALGAHYVLFPEYEGALVLTKRILRHFNISSPKI